jgi:hydrogenase nickel incorporation protein HypA/HybF
VHELAVGQAIFDIARERAEGQTVERVSVRIGHFRQVVPDALQFAWEMLTDGTDLDGCVLDIDHVPAVVACSTCAARTTLDWPVMACATCGGIDVELLSGEEFHLASIDIVQEVH